MPEIKDLLILYVFPFFSYIFQVEGQACPPTIGPFRRVGETQFYIAHETTRGNFVTYDEARELCESVELPMAQVKDLATLSVLGRTLEKIQEEEKLQDTWYWLDAIYDDTAERYKWGKDGSGGDVQYSTYLYRKHRPTGVASHVNYKHKYEIDKDHRQCLTLAMPWPGKGDPNRKGIVYGHQTILDERPCISKKTRHAMCRSDKTDCLANAPDPFLLMISQNTNDYFEYGNWILGDRKYIVNWKHRTLEDTEKYCKELGLELVDPGVVSPSLIPFLKMWSRNVTVSQFWTSLKFEQQSQTFLTKDGAEVGKQKIRVEFKDGSRASRSNKHSPDFCVALSLAYEFKNQMACEDPSSSACSWSFIDYIPANCNNYLAAICQHSNQKDRSDLNWEQSYLSEPNGINKALSDTAATKDFGLVNNKKVIRSTYKQTFGSLECPPGYRMLREGTRKWWVIPRGGEGKELYIYDYKETYWVVDEEEFNKNIDSDCTVSYPEPIDGDGHTRDIRKVKCVEWHFYLCTISNKPFKKKAWNSPPPPTMEWSDARQPRIYPLVS